MLTNINLDWIKSLISRSLTNSYIEHDCFILIEVLRGQDGMKEKSINLKLHKLIKTFKCRKNTESENPKVVRTKNGRIMLLSKC